MAAPQLPDPVKLFLAILWTDPSALESAFDQLCRNWGQFDFVGPDHPFEQTDYYEQEMGSELKRRLVAFDQLVPPEMIGPAKLATNEIEDRLSQMNHRRVNLDIGYLDHNKIVLASCKSAGQKIHLGNGIYADLVARYSHGEYRPFEWTFPDFKEGRYHAELSEIRRRYLAQLKQLRGRT